MDARCVQGVDEYPLNDNGQIVTAACDNRHPPDQACHWPRL